MDRKIKRFYNLSMSEAEQSITPQTALTEKDRELIHAQCEIQQATSPEEIEGFTKAYAKAKDVSSRIDWKTTTPDNVVDLVKELALMTDPEKNKNGFRKIPVTFAS